MRAAIAAESAAIPSVAILCEGFGGQASATARGHGFDGLAVAVTDGHVDAQSPDQLVQSFREVVVDQVIAGLTEPVDDASATNDEPAAVDTVASGTIDAIQVAFRERGWTDGHPVVPPTKRRAEAFLADSGHDPWKVLGIAPSSGRDVTVWSVAVNGVMAGCEPHHLPVLLALAEVLLDPAYGVEHSGNTTGADALIIVSGPNSEPLGFNHGAGALREGTHANTAIGRWLRLYLRNVFGFTADEHDRATFGNSARVVLAEDSACLAEIGWPTLSTDFGVGPDVDAVTVARMNSGTIVGSVYGSSPDEIVPYLGNGLARTAAWDLTHVHGLGHHQFSPLLVLSPVLARIFGRAGWSKLDVQEAMFDHARISAETFERFIGEWSNLTAGRRRLTDLVAEGALPRVYATGDDPGRLVPIATHPGRFRIAVAGDPNRTNAYAFSNDGPHGWWTSRAIDHTPASDLVCSVDASCRL
ncbi:MAG: UGSC family (seleno)protein [Actinomycetota bacterium]